MNEFWLHPALVLLLGAVLLPAIPARLKKSYLLAIPVLTFARILFLSKGTFFTSTMSEARRAWNCLNDSSKSDSFFRSGR